MRIIALIPLWLLLSACQTTGPLDENSPSTSCRLAAGWY